MDTKDVNEVEFLEAFDVSLDTGGELRSLDDIQISGLSNGLDGGLHSPRQRNRIKGASLGWARSFVLDLLMGIWEEEYTWIWADLSSSLCSKNFFKVYFIEI